MGGSLGAHVFPTHRVSGHTWESRFDSCLSFHSGTQRCHRALSVLASNCLARPALVGASRNPASDTEFRSPSVYTDQPRRHFLGLLPPPPHSSLPFFEMPPSLPFWVLIGRLLCASCCSGHRAGRWAAIVTAQQAGTARGQLTFPVLCFLHPEGGHVTCSG